MSVTHMMIHKRADNCRDRVDMTHSFRVSRPARRPSRPGAAWWDMTLRSRGGHRSPGLSKWVGPMASTRSALERATCGSRSTLAADTSRFLRASLPPFFKQVAWGSESRNRALLPHKTTSYQSATSGTGLHRPWEGADPSRRRRVGKKRRANCCIQQYGREGVKQFW